MSVTIALNTSTIRGCGAGLREVITRTAQVGYGGIELWENEIRDFIDSGGDLGGLRDHTSSVGLEVCNIISFFEWAHPDGEARRRAHREAEEVIAIARGLDCRYVAAPPAGIADGPRMDLETLAGHFREVLRVFEGTGVQPLLEFWGHSRNLKSLGEACRVLDAVGRDEVRILGDVFHMAKTPGSFDYLRQVPGDRIGIVHINDYPRREGVEELDDSERVFPGDGAAPLPEILGTLKGNGYRGPISLELFNTTYQKKGLGYTLETGYEKTAAFVRELEG